MEVQTTRFGLVNVGQEDLITLPEGLLGFNDLRKFVILEDPDDLVFAWLQSCEKPHVAFPILEPELFAQDYKVRLNKADREMIGLPGTGDVSFRLFTIVTIPNDVNLMTANMKAPVVLNVASRKAKQVVTQENDHSIKHPIFNELQQRLFNGSGIQVPAKTSGSGQRIAVRLDRPTSPTPEQLA